MGRMPRGTFLWPGLTRICSHGSWSALGVALAFALLVNLAISATLIWIELLPVGIRNSVWAAAALFWAASAVEAYLWDRRRMGLCRSDPAEDPFTSAQDHYLKGNWFETERILGMLLERNPRDLDAGLMRATLYRHTGRYDEAGAELDRIERLEGCGKWELEIRRERELLSEAETEDPGPTDSTKSISEAA